jgi:hypothetical protein
MLLIVTGETGASERNTVAGDRVTQKHRLKRQITERQLNSVCQVGAGKETEGLVRERKTKKQRKEH